MSESTLVQHPNIDPTRLGDWIQTRSGVKFYLLDPRPEDFRIEDIAHALSMTCRFAGHVREFYSVAEHSVRVARILSAHPRRVQLTGLLHDATEAYISDMARPFKRLPEFEAYRDVEDRLMEHVAARYGLIYPLPGPVKLADEIMLGTEARDLMWPVVDDWHLRYTCLSETITPWSPTQAKHEFLDLFNRLERSQA